MQCGPEFGGSPLLQQRKATLQRCESEFDLMMRFSAGLKDPGLKPIP
jgi:hypothetical protein